MEVKAIARGVRVQPRKVRIVADRIRGKSARHVATLLQFHPSKAARILKKVIESAVANAENNHGLDGDRLRIATIMVDEGPRIKRIQPRAMGRAYRIVKKSSHITVVVEEFEGTGKKPAGGPKPKPRPSFDAKGKPKKKAKAEKPADETTVDADTPAEETVGESESAAEELQAEAPEPADETPAEAPAEAETEPEPELPENTEETDTTETDGATPAEEEPKTE